MEVEGHDGFFVSFERSDQAGVLFVIHGLIFKLYEVIRVFKIGAI